MMAAVTLGPGRMEVCEQPETRTPPDRALVAVESVGLCGSDVHLYEGTHPYSAYPCTHGHEFGGTVRLLPDGYQGAISVGDRVAVEPLEPCGRCYPCRRGRPNCCVHLRVLGVHLDGALQEQVAVRPESLHPVGDLEPDLAALVEPVSIGLQATVRAEVTDSERIVVVGAGAIGQAVLLAARDRGAHVLVADLLEHRLRLASRPRRGGGGPLRKRGPRRRGRGVDAGRWCGRRRRRDRCPRPSSAPRSRSWRLRDAYASWESRARLEPCDVARLDVALTQEAATPPSR